MPVASVEITVVSCIVHYPILTLNDVAYLTAYKVQAIVEIGCPIVLPVQKWSTNQMYCPEVAVAVPKCMAVEPTLFASS